MTAVSTGVFSSDLVNREPGPLNHSRWRTTASRDISYVRDASLWSNVVYNKM